MRSPFFLPALRPVPRPARAHAAALAVALLVAVLVPLAGPSSTAEARVPRAPHRYSAKIEPLASYVGQSTCSPAPKKGTVAFANLLLRTYPSSRSLGISRACGSGGQSEHKEGRAFDWGMSVRSTRDRAAVKALFTWLMKTDRHGNRYAMARRLGIQYMIWNRRIWGAYSADRGWRKYTGANPHTDHVHFSLSWAGARKQTSFWNPRHFPGSSTPPPPAPTPTEPEPTTPAPPPPTGGGSHPAKPEPATPATLASGTPLVSERVDVPAAKRYGARPTGALVAGHRYLVEAWGTYRFAQKSGSVADPECSRVGSSWYRDRSLRRDDRWADHLDLYIDGHDLYSEADDGQACDTGSHTYRWLYTAPRSGRAPLAVWDPNSYADNTGSLRVRLTDLDAPRTSASWSVPANLAAGATGPALAGGVEYDVTVTGTWRDGGGTTVDAECTQTGYDGGWRRELGGDDHFDALLANLGDRLVPSIEGVRMEPVTDTGDRCDAGAHRYTFTWTPDHTQPLSLRVDDPNGRSGNTGSLRVQVRPHVEEQSPLTTEQVAVDSTSSSAQTTAQEFPAGTQLRLTAVGAYLMRASTDWVAGDAECTAASSDRVWRSQRFSGWFDGAKQPLGDVAVDGQILTWRPSDGSGDCDESAHTYTLDYTVPDDGRVSLQVADDDRSDNRGTVTVTVEPR